MKRWHAALARLGLSTPVRRDIAGAVVLFLFVLTGVIRPSPTVGPTADGPQLLGIGLALLECSGIAFRRASPLTGLTITMAAVAGQRLLLPVFMQTGFAVFFVVYAVAAYRPRARAAVAIGIAATLDMSLSIASDVAGQLAAASPDSTAPLAVAGVVLVGIVMGFLAPGLLGAYVRTRRQRFEELEDRAKRLEHEREIRAARAVADERGRIARELHDVAAHHLSGIVVQAGAAESLVDHDPARAKQLLRELRGQGRETLRSMRFLVGVLRAGDDDGGQPQPGFGDIQRLVDQARATGTNVTFEPSGNRPELAPEVALASYRIVQEALSNARKHAPGASVEIRITRDAEVVQLHITNDPAPAGPLPTNEEQHGFGLIGMKERIELLGGTLQVGPRRGGGWAVRAQLPTAGLPTEGTS